MEYKLSSSFLWDIFISHASEDKDSVAIPLSKFLEQKKIIVWIDNQELMPGDSIRRKIDEGLAKSKYGTVILSKYFFGKEWPQKELDALIARERFGARVIIPIWHRITEEEIASFSPILADRFAIDTSKGIEIVASEIAHVINYNNKISLKTENESLLSWKDLHFLTRQSIDPKPLGKVMRVGMNAHLSDSALRSMIITRNETGKPTYLLRNEYETRLLNRKI